VLEVVSVEYLSLSPCVHTYPSVQLFNPSLYLRQLFFPRHDSTSNAPSYVVSHLEVNSNVGRAPEGPFASRGYLFAYRLPLLKKKKKKTRVSL